MLWPVQAASAVGGLVHRVTQLHWQHFSSMDVALEENQAHSLLMLEQSGYYFSAFQLLWPALTFSLQTIL